MKVVKISMWIYLPKLWTYWMDLKLTTKINQI